MAEKEKHADRFMPVKRTALDGVIWWVVYDKNRHDYSSYLCHGKYRLKRDCEYAIRRSAALFAN